MKPHHEKSLPLACELAAACHASLSLVTVVPRRNDLSGSEGASGRLLPLTARAALEVREREACEYLQQVAARLQMTCLQQANSQQTSNREFVPPATSWRVIRGEPASALVSFFADARIDLVVIASHALPAWQAFWEGSVTPRLLTQWRRPVLLVKARN
jgi:nucleotide-binding universal stress UspA family protein